MSHPNGRSSCDEATPTALLHAAEQFNSREFFECHETLERAWLAEQRPVRTLYKGILQVGVGCYHLLRGNYHGAVTKLASGAGYLQPFAPACQGVRVGQLINDAWRLHAHLVTLGRERLAEADLSLIPQLGLAID